MTISSTNRKAGPYAGNDVAVSFPFAFKVFAAADVLVVFTSASNVETVLTLTTNYTVSLNSNQDTNPGGTVTLLTALATGEKLTLSSAVANLQPVDLTNNGGFYPAVINKALDRATIQIQQLAEKVGRALVWPISSSGATLPSPESGKFIGWNDTADSLVNLAGTGTIADAENVGSNDGAGGSLWVSVAGFISRLISSVGASVVGFTQGVAGATTLSVQDVLRETVSVKRFGAVGDGVTDDTSAIQAAINSGVALLWSPGTYAVTTLDFSATSTNYTFDNAWIKGIAATPTDAIVKISCWNTDFHNLKVNLNFNTNYTAGIWWYNAANSSQFISIFGLEMRYGYTGLVYGELRGNTDTFLAQSENQIYGFKTRGVQNPFYGNHRNGFLFFSEPIFVAHNEEWATLSHSSTFDWTAATAFENEAGNVIVHGGEIQKAGSNLGYAAKLATSCFTDTVIESACPIQIIGDAVKMTGCRHFMTVDSRSQYKLASWVNKAIFRLINCEFDRTTGIGAYDRYSIVDASSAPATNEINMWGCDTLEWAFTSVAANCPFILGGIPRYINNRSILTAADLNVYRIDNCRENLLESRGIDSSCQTLTGWYLQNDYGGGTTLTTVTDNPTGSIYGQCINLNATGNAKALTTDNTSTATVLATALRVRPGQVYLLEADLKNISAGTNINLIAKFYDVTGAALTTGPLSNGEYLVSDKAGVGLVGTAWGKSMAFIVCPVDAALMAVGLRGNVSENRIANVSLYKA